MFVLPSFLEGLPVPTMEFMACGGAVVPMDCLGTWDCAVNGVNCLMVPTRDSGALSKAVIPVLTDKVLSDKLRMIGLGTAPPWTYGRMESIFLETLKAAKE